MDDIFDVAISFVESHDRALAEELDSALSARLDGPVFVYWRHQATLAGKRQEDGFGPVFRSNSRIVVVLLRPEWGSRGGTLVEAQEIHRRHLTGDKDFVYFLATTESIRLPDWAPPSLVYFDLTKYPLADAVEGIVAMVGQRRAAASGPSPALARIRARRNAEADADQRRYFLQSQVGLEIARQGARSLLDGLHEYVEAFNRDNPDIRLSVRTNRMRDQVLVSVEGYVSLFEWNDPISHRNRIPEVVYAEADGLLQLRYDDATPVTPGRVAIRATLQPSVDDEQVLCWQVASTDRDDPDVLQWEYEQRPNSFTPEDLIRYCVERILERLAAE